MTQSEIAKKFVVNETVLTSNKEVGVVERIDNQGLWIKLFYVSSKSKNHIGQIIKIDESCIEKCELNNLTKYI